MLETLKIFVINYWDWFFIFFTLVGVPLFSILCIFDDIESSKKKKKRFNIVVEHEFQRIEYSKVRFELYEDIQQIKIFLDSGDLVWCYYDILMIEEVK